MGTMLAYWPEPGEHMGDFAASTLDGFPDRAELARIYLEQTGRDAHVLKYWHALGLWKIAIIAEGVMRRAMDTRENKAASGRRPSSGSTRWSTRPARSPTLLGFSEDETMT